jgi:HPt (histidine-containing phosphotransfer) domain-containing protein
MEPDDTPPVDVARFRETMREAGVEEIVEPTLLLYRQEAGRRFEELSVALQRGDTEAVSAAAHALKSSSLNVFASKLARLLEELESAARAGKLEAAHAAFGRVRSEYEAAIAYVTALTPETH